MHITSFHQKFKKTLLIIENIINKYEEKIDLDYIFSENMITIIFKNKNKIIINSQEYLKQLWIATSNQGYHLIFKKNTWKCIRTNQKIKYILEKEFFNQTKNKIYFSNLNQIKK
ncbi:Iron-sulfur cluster assembly protein CyaY [Buchnera aphidicola (Cinara piceae)]|uniref:Iron-sulfur cluster assembly protein CyaY n=1 Tax=Buchnera aphidicola (Cinara piceae) TaxID=1660043 RepID=A0A803GD78_9GAMM|nr:iron donor protein CyaY [Buchnera aphidicola]VFP88820.1 Iron-sulfur cluster assembly protein CyaY [Buchnera aphidicola (Cinara piceae)]